MTSLIIEAFTAIPEPFRAIVEINYPEIYESFQNKFRKLYHYDFTRPLACNDIREIGRRGSYAVINYIDPKRNNWTGLAGALQAGNKRRIKLIKEYLARSRFQKCPELLEIALTSSIEQKIIDEIYVKVKPWIIHDKVEAILVAAMKVNNETIIQNVIRQKIKDPGSSIPLCAAIRANNRRMINEHWHKWTYNTHNVISTAISAGHNAIAKKLLNDMSYSYFILDTLMATAISCNNQEFTEYMVNNYWDQLSHMQIYKHICIVGNQDLFNLLLTTFSSSSINFDTCLIILAHNYRQRTNEMILECLRRAQKLESKIKALDLIIISNRTSWTFIETFINQSGMKLYNTLLIASAQIGNMDWFQRAINLGGTNYHTALFRATHFRHINIVNYILSQNFIKCPNKILNIAAMADSRELMDYAITSLNADDVNKALIGASVYCNVNSMEYLIKEKGANAFQRARRHWGIAIPQQRSILPIWHRKAARLIGHVTPEDLELPLEFKLP